MFVMIFSHIFEFRCDVLIQQKYFTLTKNSSFNYDVQTGKVLKSD